MDTTGLEFAARGSALLLAALLLCLVLRPAAARVRGAVLLTALLGLVLLPAATWLLPSWHAPVLPAFEDPVETPASTAVPHELPGPAEAKAVPLAVSTQPRPSAPQVIGPASAPAPPDPLTAAAAPAAQADSAAAPSEVVPALSRVDWLLLVWLVGVLAVLLAWFAGLVRTRARVRGTRWLARSEVALPEGIAVGVHRSVPSPLTVGLFRSTILLPEEASSWPPETLAAALLHEAAHARRRDVLATGVARVACALHWFNPLVWIAAAWLRRNSELACDEAVLQSGMAPATFAETLVRLARSARSVRLHGAAAGWGRSGLERRVEAALRGPTSRRGRLRPIAAVLVLGLVFVAAATVRPTPEIHAEETPDRATETVLTVGRVDCDHATIQGALDAAPEGARIRIAAGSWEETLVIEKPVTVEGAGWTRTRLTSKLEPVRDYKQRPLPTVRIRAAKGVVLRGLRISLEGKEKEGVHLGGAAVDIEASQVRMEDCAVIPSPASGIDISGDSDVVIQRCLVAAIGSRGIRIGGRGAGMPRVRVLDSDVRYGHGRCISIGASCDDVVIEGCRISGSGWHGIRYDNASPTIRRNRITDNVRSGIYASGRTRATIEENLFADQGLGGISCWFVNGDVIRNNTFAHNAREGLSILGGSNPTVTKNVFADNPIGVKWASIAGGRGGSVPSERLGTVRGNVFFRNEENLSGGPPSGTSNPTLDPMLGPDYVLDEESPARSLGVGATDLPSAASPFPVQPEEEAAARRYEEHLDKYGAWKRSRSPSPRESAHARSRAANKVSRAWLAAIRAPEDDAVREDALQEIHEALGSEEQTQQLAALRTLAWLGGAEYDRGAFREHILPHAHAEDPDTRWAARLALVRVKPEPAVDLPLWLEEAQTATFDNAEETAESIVLLTEGVLEGQAADAILHLLRDGTDIRKAFVIRGLQEVTKFDPRIEARMVEIVRSVPAHSYDSSYYFHFITPKLDPKSDAVVDVILFRLVEGKTSLGTLLPGLRKGLSAAQKRRAADGLLELFENAESKHAQRYLLEALSWVANASQRKRAHALAREMGLDPAAKGPMGPARGRIQRPANRKQFRALEQARKKTRKWRETIVSGTDGEARKAALKELRAAFDSDDAALRRAALGSAAWLGEAEFDRDDYRAAILPHAQDEDEDTRRAALLALVRIKPDPAIDLPLWLEEVKTADRHIAELATESIVKLVDGVLEGAVADAVLHLLRDGTDIRRAFVIRGLQGVRTFDPRVQARMIEVVRSAPAESYDSVYYFIFIAPKLDPKSDAVMDVILFRLAEGKYALDDVAKGLRTGLSGAQRKRVADRLLEIHANAGTHKAQYHLFDALSWTADASHVERLEALRERSDLTKVERARLEKAIEAARTR